MSLRDHTSKRACYTSGMDSPLFRDRGIRRFAAGTLIVAFVLVVVLCAACTGATGTGTTSRPASTLSTVSITSASTTTSWFAGAPSSETSSTAATVATATSTTLAPTTDSSTTTLEPAPQPPLAFSTTRAMEHIKKLASDIGIRPGGSAAEDEAVSYVSDYLTGLGYDPVITEVPLSNGKISHDVVVTKKGTSPLTILVSGHLDSKPTTPGANDDASGAAAVLELARDFAGADQTPTLVFALFGTEEIIDANKTHHHFGSRAYVKNMTDAERDDLVGMISLDMIAYGNTFNLRTMGKGPRTLRDMLQAYAGAQGDNVAYLKDTGPTGWSDHEPFELAGYPALWIQWLTDPTYHKAGDTYQHIKTGPVQTTGSLMLGFLAGLTPQDLDQLHAAVRR